MVHRIRPQLSFLVSVFRIKTFLISFFRLIRCSIFFHTQNVILHNKELMLNELCRRRPSRELRALTLWHLNLVAERMAYGVWIQMFEMRYSIQWFAVDASLIDSWYVMSGDWWVQRAARLAYSELSFAKCTALHPKSWITVCLVSSPFIKYSKINCFWWSAGVLLVALLSKLNLKILGCMMHLGANGRTNRSTFRQTDGQTENVSKDMDTIWARNRHKEIIKWEGKNKKKKQQQTIGEMPKI